MTRQQRWSGATKAPVVKRKPCRFGCGQSVDVFTEQGRCIQLDTEPPPVTLDLTTVRLRIYEYRGPYVGWVPKFLAERSWRELRLLHECSAQHGKAKR